MLGTIGGEQRLSAGVIGDSTNTAARIEALTKRYAAPILVSENTLRGCADPGRYQTRPVDRVRPKGKTKPIAILEVLDGLEGAELEGKLASGDDFVHGIELYQAGEPGEALVCFAAALKAYPADRAAQLYIGRCWNLIEHGLPDDWDGVVTLSD
jgi:hemerythrin